MKVYLDTCILIYRNEGPEPFSQLVRAAAGRASDATYCISDLVRLECLVHPLRCGDSARVEAYAAVFRDLVTLAMNPDVFTLAAHLRAAHRLKTPDALHAATAVHHGCDELWTGDRRLASLEKHIRLHTFSWDE